MPASVLIESGPASIESLARWLSNTRLFRRYLRTRFWNAMEDAFGPDDIPDIDFVSLKNYLNAIRVFFYNARKEKDGTEPDVLC